MKITVLAGGCSTERDVSLVSASLVAAALRRKGHRVALVDVYLGTDVNGEIDSCFTSDDTFRWSIEEKEPDLEALKKKGGNGDALVGKNVLELCRAANLVFIGLHGGMGENGQIQAFLDCYGIKYTGTDYASSLLAMDKEITKALFKLASVPTPEGLTAVPSTSEEEIEKKIGYPCVIKPCSGGSSVGVSLADNREELIEALKSAFIYESKVIVEKKAIGREMTVGILSGKTLPPVEIVPKSGFYDYKNKYQSGMTDEFCPPDITDREWDILSETAMKAANALHINTDTYCRVDIILTPDGPMCLEVNTLPGMTPLSLLPREANAIGIDYDTLCETIAESALKK